MDSYNPEDVDNALVEFIAERNKIQFEAFIASHPEAQLKCGGGFIFDPGRLSTTAAAELKAIKQSSCPTRLDRLGRFLFCTRATLMRLEISLAMSQYVDHDRAELAEMKNSIGKASGGSKSSYPHSDSARYNGCRLALF
jgi:hypothetical protein